MDFAIPANDRIKVKESERIGKYLDLARGLKTVEDEVDSDTKHCCIF